MRGPPVWGQCPGLLPMWGQLHRVLNETAPKTLRVELGSVRAPGREHRGGCDLGTPWGELLGAQVQGEGGSGPGCRCLKTVLRSRIQWLPPERSWHL